MSFRADVKSMSFRTEERGRNLKKQAFRPCIQRNIWCPHNNLEVANSKLKIRNLKIHYPGTCPLHIVADIKHDTGENVKYQREADSQKR
jgi:hypothetical protein